MSSLLEYTEEELLSRPFMEFVHPLDKDKTLTELQNIVEGKPTYYIENRYITKSGKAKWLAWTTTDASEQGVLYCAAKDITEKKELEELLNKATVLARIGGWEVDVVKQTVYWSNITREIHEVDPGYQPDIDSIIDFYKKGEDRETIVKKLEDAIIYGTSGDAELQIVTTMGNTKWVRVIVEAEFADGKCLRLYGSIQDIDARKKAEMSGNQALEERNIILESIDDAFFAVDKNWVVTYWNNMAEKVLGTPKNKILNNNLWEIFSDSIDSVSYKKYHEALETNQAAHFEDYYQPVKKWYEISAYPSNTGLSVYFKDVTERKTSETQLKELNETLQKHAKELAISNAELEQFAYVASHDLQEPLRMVTSFLTQLDKKYGTIIDDKGKQYIHFAVDGAKRMRQIILDLLDFSRVGRVEDDMEEVDFNKLINEILALYRRSIEELRANIEFEDLPVFSIYKTPVRQVFQNLIGNSLKYHRKNEPPAIVIACKESKTQYQFSIKDNGIGIASEYFDKVFIIFQRLHNKDEYSGTGMGLAIAKKIIENMGGKIWIESEEGKGSTFYFTILKTNKI
jgi:PAS domain S-box-containing protein